MYADKPAATRAQRAFTIVEMMVVIGIIALVLAFGVPAFNSMAVQQRLSKTRQLLNGTLLRTHVVSVSDQTQTAVRLCPADWLLHEDAAMGPIAGRQIMTTYSYVSTSAANPSNPTQVLLDDRFERIADGPTQLLPPATWIAPSEALDDIRKIPIIEGWGNDYIGDYVLDGTIGEFDLNADDRKNPGEEVLDADDFLIVFDPETGVRGSQRRQPWRLLAFDPREEGDAATAQLETDGERDSGTGQTIEPFQRFNFTGTVIYQRDAFTALGAAASSPDEIRARRGVLRRYGQTYYVDRTGGNLVSGGGEAVEED